ncbi:MAG TPA: sigma-70 family RNA polymerase sigma factor, partial [Actinomycetota bacterium]|nr:sigma-70 family RNA polymerase sigma factor [Actinomycetota bacterium]
MTARRADDFHPRPQLLDPAEERDLVLAFKAGDTEAYERIYDLYMPRARNICRRMLGDEHDAEEACQEVFLRVYQGLPRFNGRYQLGAWIARIATNRCLDVLRARSRKPGDAAAFDELDEAPEPVGRMSDPEVIYIRKAEGRRVRKVLDSLPPLHRAAIVLRDFEGLPYCDIAEILGVTDVQLKALLHRARKGFKRSWPSEALQVLVPARLLDRFRKGGEEARQVPQNPGTSQVAEVVSSATPAVSSCVGALQHCGQAVTEKVASLMTVAVVGTASMGAAAVIPATAEGLQNAIGTGSAAATTARAPQKSSRLVVHRAANDAPQVAEEDPPVVPPEPQPTPSAEPTPEPPPTPTPAATTGEGG